MSVDQQDLQRINGALKELEAMSGRTMTRLIKGATVQASRSAAKNTRSFTPKKKRPFKRINIAQDHRGRRLREKRGFPWWAKYAVFAWEAGKPKNPQQEITLYARTDSSFEKKRSIPNKGVAKRAWLFSLRRLDKSIGAPKPIDGIAQKYNQTRIDRNGRDIHGVTIINTVNYNVFAARGAVQEATRSTANWLEKRVKIEEEKLQRAFEQKAAKAAG